MAGVEVLRLTAAACCFASVGAHLNSTCPQPKPDYYSATVVTSCLLVIALGLYFSNTMPGSSTLQVMWWFTNAGYTLEDCFKGRGVRMTSLVGGIAAGLAVFAQHYYERAAP